ncbi:MAG: efflux RND transporter periplasmic adaptor subunit [Proteobacteria bacterium]|nr:efflux RND transporter periplasmic adaptor subunit [Pseudomonadota bacterium]
MTSPIPKKAPDGMDYVPVYEEKSAGDTKGKIAYYVAPMHPWYTSDKPGKAPDCGMDLVPVYEGEKNVKGIHVDPAIIQSIGVRTEDISRRKLTKTIRTSGVVEVDESRLYTITPKFMGWIETLHVDTTGQSVQKNDTLLTIYSPDLVSAQEEYLTALKYQNKMQESTLDEVKNEGKDMVESVLRRLKYWDVPDNEIEALVRRGKPERTVKMTSPARGIVLEKMVTSGQRVEAGMPLYKIADLSKVWVSTDIFQSDLSWIRTGQSADVELSYMPGKTFKGKAVYIYPYLNMDTRTAKVRIELANTPDFDLKPGMFASVNIDSLIAVDAIAVPEQAIIRSGSRYVAVVALGGGYFEPRDIKAGVTADGFIQVLGGLHEGEKLVTSAQFLIDSESNLKAAVSGMTKPPITDQAAMSMDKKDAPVKKEDKVSTSAMDTMTNMKPDDKKPEKSIIKSDSVPYTCVMHPQIIRDKPGSCPLCGMTLVPKK